MQSYIKLIARCLFVLVPALMLEIMITNAEATWYFTWTEPVNWQSWNNPLTGDQESSFSSWDGYFTVPDNAYTKDPNDSSGFIDLSQFKDFSFTATLWDGTLMNGTSFNAMSPDRLYTFEGPGSLGPSSGGNAIDFKLEDPYGVHSSIQLILGEEIGLNGYIDNIYLPTTSELVSLNVSFGGTFVGHHVNDATPVPEPTSIVLIGSGLLLAFLARNRSNRQTHVPPSKPRA